MILNHAHCRDCWSIATNHCWWMNSMNNMLRVSSKERVFWYVDEGFWKQDNVETRAEVHGIDIWHNFRVLED